MNREDDFDAQLTRWLEDGPVTAPDRAIAAAVDHARTHPRRRLSSAALWRRAMDSMHLTPVTPQRAGHAGRSLAVAIVAVVVMAVAIVSGAVMLGRSGNEPAPGGIVAPAATASPTPAPTPARSPVAISTTLTCWETDVPTETQVGAIDQVRGLVMECTVPGTADARLQGTATVHASIDIRADQSAEIWGTMVLPGDQGSWSGAWTGIIDPGYTTHRVAAVLKGTGAYDGLQFRYTQTSSDTGTTWTVTGTIEPVPASEPTAPIIAALAVSGKEACGQTQLGTAGSVTSVSGVEQTRNAFASCFEAMSDERVSGDSTRSFNSDARADGSADWWGTGEIPNVGGTWLGVWQGTLDAKGNLVITGAWIGSGGYAGLQYRMDVVSPSDATDLTVTGTIEPVA